MANAQVVVSIDTSGEALKVTFGSVNKSGQVTGAEKALVSKAVKEAGMSKAFPKIERLTASK